MKTHVQTHFEKRFECENCKGRFRALSSLRYHIKHLVCKISKSYKRRKFDCLYCSMSFKNKHLLENHFQMSYYVTVH